MECHQFLTIFTKVLRKDATMKNNCIRAKLSGFMNKNLRKAMMRRSRLRNIVFNEKTEKSIKAYI